MASDTTLEAAHKELPELEIPGAGPVDSPGTLSSPNVLARFEFETGKGNEGTKILMVEWNPADGIFTSNETQKHQLQQDEEWDVSWQGKETKFRISERDGNEIQRVYFLIPAEITIPPVIAIRQLHTGRTLNTKPLPAIFTTPPGTDYKPEAGKRGVLHTLWAKKRLSQLQQEIRQEMQENVEGVGLEMAVQERLWIIEHFGLTDSNATSTVPPTPKSPRSPVVGRLSEKLRGLKLATSPTDLANFPNTGSHKHHHLYSLSPDASDIAIPSRSAFSQATSAARVTMGHEVASLNAIVDSKPDARPPESKGTEEGLFARPMSPRSPDMKKSPFSFLR